MPKMPRFNFVFSFHQLWAVPPSLVGNPAYMHLKKKKKISGSFNLSFNPLIANHLKW